MDVLLVPNSCIILWCVQMECSPAAATADDDVALQCASSANSSSSCCLCLAQDT